VYDEKDTQEESRDRHQVLLGQRMRQSLPYVTGAFSLLIEQSAIWVMYWAIHKGYAGLRIMITVAHTRLIVALLVSKADARRLLVVNCKNLLALSSIEMLSQYRTKTSVALGCTTERLATSCAVMRFAIAVKRD